MSRRNAHDGCAVPAGLLIALALTALLHAELGPALIRGVVRSRDLAVAGATVRVQTTGVATVTNGEGEFVLEAPVPGNGLRVTARDNDAYEFLSPFASSNDKAACENCHSTGQESSRLPFDEWAADAHSRSARDARFLSVYRGTDLTGRHRSQPTRFAAVQDYGRVALRPDPSAPDYGPGYKLDFPGAGGNCGACHAPVAALRTPYSTELEELPAARAGITCDFCHKVAGVRLDPANGLPHANTPGVLAFSFLRPPAGAQLFLGPLDDVAPGDDAYSPLHRQSRFCAPCHFGQFWGVPVYNSFGEWMESPWARGEGGRTCQDCHMRSRGASSFVPLEKGGRVRESRTIASHRMRGPDDPAFMESAARLELEAVPEGRRLRVTVAVTNSGAGHALPTDYPGRNVLLVVSIRPRQSAQQPRSALGHQTGSGNQR